jgi:hypothetical protein
MVRYEHELRQTGIDRRKDEVKMLINKIIASENEMYDRRKKIEGFDIIMADGKTPILVEAIDSYILGHFHATVALCAMAAERFLYDFVDFADIKIQDKTLNDKQKEYLYKLSSRNLIDFFCEIGTINDKTKSMLHQISNIRNEQVHPQKMENSSNDAIKILNLLCNVLEEKLSLFKYYDLKDGVLVLKDQYKQPTNK